MQERLASVVCPSGPTKLRSLSSNMPDRGIGWALSATDTGGALSPNLGSLLREEVAGIQHVLTVQWH